LNTKTKSEENQDRALVPAKQNAEALIAKAIDKNVPVETMERLLAMRRELNAEWAKEAFDRSMSAFQADCPTIEKTKAVKTKLGIVAYKYAPIESIVSQVKEFLKKHGFSYSTTMGLIENGTMKVRVAIKVTHAAGHSEITEMTVPLGNKTDIMSQTQVVASAQTFAKRYAFCNAFGILTGDEDSDANTQTQIPKTQPITEAKPIYTGNGRISYRQSNFIRDLLKQKGYTEKDLFNKYKIANMAELTSIQASQIIENLQKLPMLDESDQEAEAIANDAAAALS
jgi:ERF superfamily